MISANLIYPILIAAFVGYFLRAYISDQGNIFRSPSFWGMFASVGLVLFYVFYTFLSPGRVLMSWVVLGATVLIAAGAVAVNLGRRRPRSFSVDL